MFIHEGDLADSLHLQCHWWVVGIMTAKLMAPFMRSFRDEYVAVRKEACIAAGNLGINDDYLISELLRLGSRDPIWRIKALAIQGNLALIPDRNTNILSESSV